EGNAVARLAQERGVEAVAVALLAVATFEPAVPRPQFAAVGHPAGQREEVLGQRTTIPDSTGTDGVIVVHDQRRIARLVERAAAVRGKVHAPTFSELD